MNRFTLCFFTCVIFGITLVSAQNPKIELGQKYLNYADGEYKFETDSIQSHSFSKKEIYFRIHPDSAWNPVGRHAKNLKPYVENNSIAYTQYKKYQRKHFVGAVVTYVGGAFFVPMVFLATPVGAMAVLSSTGTSGMLLTRNAENNLDLAIDEINTVSEPQEDQLENIMVSH